MKTIRCLLLISALILCFLFVFTGCEVFDDFTSINEKTTSDQANHQTNPSAQSMEQSNYITTAPQVTTEQATESEPEVEADLEYCKRAAVTAMTNYCAFDGKKHSYSDTSGDREYYYMFVTSWGTWTKTDNKTYHVEDLLLRTYGKEDGPTEWDSTAYKFTLDVTYNAANNTYTISKVHPAYKETGEYSYTNMDYCASHSLFTVPFSLIERDR